MKLRVIQLINNFFRDADCSDENREKALGTYFTFGYFDALQVAEGKDFSETEENLIYKELDALAVETLDGTCSRRNLVCIADNKDKDKTFWELAEQYPYLFVSLIRLRHDAGSMENMDRVIADSENDSTAIAYYSYNHSELVIVKLENCYNNGMKFVLGLRRQLNTLNMYSIFSVREDMLKSKNKLFDKIEKEEVSVRLRIMIKNDQKISNFLQKLENILFQDETRVNENSPEKEFVKYYTLGSYDLTVEIERVEMYKLLLCYGMGSLLTHTNEFFGEAVYNIETEILVKGERLKNGKSVDNGENQKA